MKAALYKWCLLQARTEHSCRFICVCCRIFRLVATLVRRFLATTEHFTHTNCRKSTLLANCSYRASMLGSKCTFNEHACDSDVEMTDHSTTASPPAAVRASFSFSASSCVRSDFTFCGTPSTNFFACSERESHSAFPQPIQTPKQAINTDNKSANPCWRQTAQTKTSLFSQREGTWKGPVHTRTGGFSGRMNDSFPSVVCVALRACENEAVLGGKPCSPGLDSFQEVLL